MHCIKISLFWDVTPCSPVEDRRHFGGITELHGLGPRTSNQKLHRSQVSTGGTNSPVHTCKVWRCHSCTNSAWNHKIHLQYWSFAHTAWLSKYLYIHVYALFVRKVNTKCKTICVCLFVKLSPDSSRGVFFFLFKFQIKLSTSQRDIWCVTWKWCNLQCHVILKSDCYHYCTERSPLPAISGYCVSGNISILSSFILFLYGNSCNDSARNSNCIALNELGKVKR
jgi:hypothetical protein